MHGVMTCDYDILRSVRFSSNVEFSSFSPSWCIQQSISMWRTQPSVEWVQCHFLEGIFAGQRLWPSTELYNEDRERMELNFLGHLDVL